VKREAATNAGHGFSTGRHFWDEQLNLKVQELLRKKGKIRCSGGQPAAAGPQSLARGLEPYFKT
jgi:hypothetical protein